MGLEKEKMFLQSQIEEIQAELTSYPVEQHGEVTMLWIKECAAEYRVWWESNN
jgi:hypothetical protein